ncbi:uncharacterized protein LOC144552814 isoform X2 [Carex rostrata]
MRIRGRSLPFPPLISSSDPYPASTISLLAPNMDSTTEQNAGDSARVKIEQVLHPNVYLLPTISHASSSFSPPSSTSLSPAQKEEADQEKKGGESESAVESRRNNNAQVSISNRTTDCQDKDQGKPNCTMMRNKQKEGKTVVVKEKKTMRNSTVLVEGSRCSRVNGRGWRCCQPTLVGYLLCEHHLGKGRMRNMSYNASRGQLGCTENKRNLSESGSVDIAVRKKRNIVPTGKARSISSLFDDEDGTH